MLAGPTHPGRAGIGLTSSPCTSSFRQDLRGAETGGEEPSGPFEFYLRHPGVWEENTASRKGLPADPGGPCFSGHLAPSRPFWVSGLLFLRGSVSHPDIWEPGFPLSLSSPCSHP